MNWKRVTFQRIHSLRKSVSKFLATHFLEAAIDTTISRVSSKVLFVIFENNQVIEQTFLIPQAFLS